MNITRLRDALDAARKSDSEIKKELTDPSFLMSTKHFQCNKEELMKLLPTPATPLVDLMNDPEVCVCISVMHIFVRLCRIKRMSRELTCDYFSLLFWRLKSNSLRAVFNLHARTKLHIFLTHDLPIQGEIPVHPVYPVTNINYSLYYRFLFLH